MAIFEQPPESSDYELREYLARVNIQVNSDLSNSNQIPRLTAIPSKLSIGKLYYFLNAVAATPVSGEGLYIYKSTGFVLIA